MNSQNTVPEWSQFSFKQLSASSDSWEPPSVPLAKQHRNVSLGEAEGIWSVCWGWWRPHSLPNKCLVKGGVPLTLAWPYGGRDQTPEDQGLRLTFPLDCLPANTCLPPILGTGGQEAETRLRRGLLEVRRKKEAWDKRVDEKALGVSNYTQQQRRKAPGLLLIGGLLKTG